MDYALSAAWVFAEYFSFVMPADAILQRRFIHPALSGPVCWAALRFAMGLPGCCPFKPRCSKLVFSLFSSRPFPFFFTQAA